MPNNAQLVYEDTYLTPEAIQEFAEQYGDPGATIYPIVKLADGRVVRNMDGNNLHLGLDEDGDLALFIDFSAAGTIDTTWPSQFKTVTVSVPADWEPAAHGAVVVQ